MERLGDNCVYCGRKVKLGLVPGCEDFALRACVDHIAPISKGGDNSDANLALACSRCNSVKGAKSLDEARPFLVQARIGWPSFSRSQLEWLEAAGFDVSPVTNGRLFREPA